MQNLVLTWEQHLVIAQASNDQETKSSKSQTVVARALDSSRDLLFLFYSDRRYAAVNVSSAKVEREGMLPPSFCRTGDASGPVSASFIHELESVIVMCESGEVYSLGDSDSADIDDFVDDFDEFDQEAKLVMTIEGGVVGCEWSPDQELCAVATADGRLLLVTIDFQVLKSWISPGWEAHFNSNGTPIDGIPRLSAGEFAVSWRGDGQFFAVSANFLEPVLRTTNTGSDTLKGPQSIWNEDFQTALSEQQILSSDQQGRLPHKSSANPTSRTPARKVEQWRKTAYQFAGSRGTGHGQDPAYKSSSQSSMVLSNTQGRGGSTLQELFAPKHLGESKITARWLRVVCVYDRSGAAVSRSAPVLDGHDSARHELKSANGEQDGNGTRENHQDSDNESTATTSSQRRVGLHANLSWRPSGNFVCATGTIQQSRFSQRECLVVLERNGLIRHSKVLSEPVRRYGGVMSGFAGSVGVSRNSGGCDVRVEGLTWNPPSNVLAFAVSERTEALENTEPRRAYSILLYGFSNWQWELKKRISLGCSMSSESCCSVFWDAEGVNRLYVIFDGSLRAYDLTWRHHSLFLSRQHQSALPWPATTSLSVAISGQYLKTTPLHKKFVPPPLADRIVVFPPPMATTKFDAYLDAITPPSALKQKLVFSSTTPFPGFSCVSSFAFSPEGSMLVYGEHQNGAPHGGTLLVVPPTVIGCPESAVPDDLDGRSGLVGRKSGTSRALTYVRIPAEKLGGVGGLRHMLYLDSHRRFSVAGESDGWEFHSCLFVESHAVEVGAASTAVEHILELAITSRCADNSQTTRTSTANTAKHGRPQPKDTSRRSLGMQRVLDLRKEREAEQKAGTGRDKFPGIPFHYQRGGQAMVTYAYRSALPPGVQVIASCPMAEWGVVFLQSQTGDVYVYCPASWHERRVAYSSGMRASEKTSQSASNSSRSTEMPKLPFKSSAKHPAPMLSTAPVFTFTAPTVSFDVHCIPSDPLPEAANAFQPSHALCECQESSGQRRVRVRMMRSDAKSEADSTQLLTLQPPPGTTLTFFGKDRRNKLYANKLLLAAQCLSYSMLKHVPEVPSAGAAFQRIYRGMLMFTVAGQQHGMFVLRLSDSVSRNFFLAGVNSRVPKKRGGGRGDEANLDRSEASEGGRYQTHANCMVRVVEKGARIVGVSMVQQGHTTAQSGRVLVPRVIMQQPRGNIEVIHPRIFGLHAIKTFLSREPPRYDLAFHVCRHSRINMNLLFDHNPVQFARAIQLVVQQLGSVEHISLFLSGLSDLDCTTGRFWDPVDHALKMTGQGDREPAEAVGGGEFPIYKTLVVTELHKSHQPQKTETSQYPSELVQFIENAVRSANGGDTGDSHRPELHSGRLGASVEQKGDIPSTTPTTTTTTTTSGNKTSSAGDPEFTTARKREQQAVIPASHKNFGTVVGTTFEGFQDNLHGIGVGLSEVPSDAQKSSSSTTNSIQTPDKFVYKGVDLTRFLFGNIDKKAFDRALSNEQRSAIRKERGRVARQKLKEYRELSKKRFDAAAAVETKVAEWWEKDRASSDICTPNETASGSSKINYVCRLVREAIMELGFCPLMDAAAAYCPRENDRVSYAHSFAMAALYSYIRQTPADLESAMRLVEVIMRLKLCDDAITSADTTTSTSAKPGPRSRKFIDLSATARSVGKGLGRSRESGGLRERLDVVYRGSAGLLRYACFLDQPRELYKVALGLYDVNLAMRTGQHTSMDPHEYVPRLNKLRSLQEAGFAAYTRYVVDRNLRRTDCALVHLFQHITLLVNRSDFAQEAAKHVAKDYARVADLERHVSACLDMVRQEKLYDLAILMFGWGLASKQNTSSVRQAYCRLLSRYADRLATVAVTHTQTHGARAATDEQGSETSVEAEGKGNNAPVVSPITGTSVDRVMVSNATLLHLVLGQGKAALTLALRSSLDPSQDRCVLNHHHVLATALCTYPRRPVKFARVLQRLAAIDEHLDGGYGSVLVLAEFGSVWRAGLEVLETGDVDEDSVHTPETHRDVAAWLRSQCHFPVDTAVHKCCAAQRYTRAVQMAVAWGHTPGAEDSLFDTLADRISSDAQALNSKLRDCRLRYQKLVNRLRVVRRAKVMFPALYESGIPEMMLRREAKTDQSLQTIITGVGGAGDGDSLLIGAGLGAGLHDLSSIVTQGAATASVASGYSPASSLWSAVTGVGSLFSTAGGDKKSLLGGEKLSRVQRFAKRRAAKQKAGRKRMFKRTAKNKGKKQGDAEEEAHLMKMLPGVVLTRDLVAETLELVRALLCVSGFARVWYEANASAVNESGDDASESKERKVGSDCDNRVSQATLRLAVRLQSELARYWWVVREQESRPMPEPARCSPAVSESLRKYWNWPAACYPQRGGGFQAARDVKWFAPGSDFIGFMNFALLQNEIGATSEDEDDGMQATLLHNSAVEGQKMLGRALRRKILQSPEEKGVSVFCVPLLQKMGLHMLGKNDGDQE